jgi:hypothetical protein
VLAVAVAVPALAQPSPQASLAGCQRAVAAESARFVAARLKVVGRCLDRMAGELIRGGRTPTEAADRAARPCVALLRQLAESPGGGRSLRRGLRTRTAARCDPAGRRVSHALDDVTGRGPGLVAEQIRAATVDGWCAQFGGDGTIGTLEEWLECLVLSHERAADTAISVQYPRALEWIALLRPAIAGVSAPGSNAARVTAALAVLDALDRSLEGLSDDDVPAGACGTHLPASGQTTPFPADRNGRPGATVPEDGTVRAGATLRFVDNADGTILDTNTGLVWEKKSDDGSLHDKDSVFPWSSLVTDTIWDWLAQVNTEGGSGFAGHADWRIPNVKELQTIIDYGRSSPAVDPAFNAACTTGCGVLTCSCTSISSFYWSSTTSAGSATSAWRVSFSDGRLFDVDKSEVLRVRAVRGGAS